MDYKELLKRKLNKKGVNLKRLYSNEELKIIKEGLLKEYAECKSISILAEKYKFCASTISKMFKLEGIEIINYQNLLRIRKDLFKSIDSEEDAYWLGFIYADGYISDGGVFELSLSYRDLEHLRKFSKYIDFSGNIIEKSKILLNSKIFYRCRLEFATQEYFDNFLSVGIVPNKTFKLTFPTFLKESLVRHFIRGIFDGDGTIGLYTNTKGKYPITSLIGYGKFMEELLQYIPKECRGNLYKDKRITKDIKIFTTANRKTEKFINYLYKGSNIYLDRKYKKYLEICTHYN